LGKWGEGKNGLGLLSGTVVLKSSKEMGLGKREGSEHRVSIFGRERVNSTFKHVWVSLEDERVFL